MNLFHKTFLLLFVLLVLVLFGSPKTFALGPKPPVPPTVDISAEPASVLSGAPVTLTWSSTNSNSCTIDNGIGGAGLNGSRIVHPTVNTTYTIVATGDGGDASDSVSITIKKPAKIISFTSSSDSINQGESVTLIWETNLANSCNISPTPGSVAVSGNVILNPDVDTTYTITASGDGGDASSTLTIIVTPPADADNDGVNDNLDTCPNTPADEPVDANGCSNAQKDSDNDGVNDNLDICSETSDGEAVDVNGCADSQKDADNDGVVDNLDSCPGTPPNAPVDTVGCAETQKDTDNDGVTDDIDICSNTPNGEEVDANGCSDSQKDDSDNDGVNDYLDNCLGTPSGETVDTNGCSNSQILANQREALIALYNNTDGDNWYKKTNWLGEAGTECDWFGVSCDSAGNVTELSFYNNILNGPIPPELGNLTNLQVLKLYHNRLSGPIPSELGNLTKITDLSLSTNQLSGPIPPELGKLTNLTVLYLNDNQLSGPIPSELGNLTNLQRLQFNNNQFSGHIPSELGTLTNLQTLWLRHNQLTGPIPSELGNLINLKYFMLEDNQLSGPIPIELGDLTSLTELHLNDNQLSGSIPAELGNLTNLQYLRLNNNQLSGPIPPELGNLTNLRDNYSDFQRNTFYTTDSELRAFLSSKQRGGDWELFPEIISFATSNESIKKGERITLSWQTNLADSCSISPSIGSVSLSGSISVKPLETTTYTLSAVNSRTSTENIAVSVSMEIAPLTRSIKTFKYDDTGRTKTVATEFD